MKRSKTFGLILITLIYLVTLVGSYLLYDVFDNLIGDTFSNNPLIIILIIDVIATILVYIFSMLFNNASIYDPYWSVMPVFMFVLYALKRGMIVNTQVIIMLIIFIIWSLRLTLNWAYTFRDIEKQDWRYQMFKDKHPKLWFLINLFGIHLFPTIVVFISMIPAFNFIEVLFLEQGVTTYGTYFGALISIVATIIEAIADIQMHQFRSVSSNNGLVNDKGLWKMCRHPNYFGEILFWIGICIMGMSFAPISDKVNPNPGLIILSPLVMFVMFAMISIPMMEKRQLENKAGYKEYVEKTPMLFPLGPKAVNKNEK